MFDEKHVEEIVKKTIEEQQRHTADICRFSKIDPQALAASVEFYENMNSLLSDTGKTAWKVVVVGTVGALMTIIGLGAIVMIREKLGF